MTPEQQQIALAKWEGFKLERGSDGEFGLINPNGLLIGSDFDPSTTMMSFLYKLPNYLNDLNAVHELEKNLKGTQWYNYRINLEDILAMERDKSSGLISAVFHATASQRCEALLRTLNLWTD